MNPSLEFSHKVVLITGGGTGNGRETARAFLAAGASVVLNGRRESVLKETALALDSSSKRVAIAAGDIGNPATARAAVAVAVQRFGGLDILVNNAGIFSPKGFLDHTEADVDSYLNVFIKGTFFASQAAIPEMKKRGGGSIVNLGSMWATIAINATPSSAYSAGKSGVHALTRNLALEFAADQIRVNAIAPAVVNTPVYSSFLTPEQVASFNSFHPLGRIGQPRDIAEAVLFLASERAVWITGVVLPVDGGVTAGRH